MGSEWNPCNRSGTATKSGYPEHKFNWLTSLAVKSRLEKLGATVYFTHPTDTGVGPCVTVRSSLGTRVGAALEVSIHADGAASEFHGFHINHPGVIKGWTDDIAAEIARAGQGDPRRDGRRGTPVANYYATNGLKTRVTLGTLNESDVPIVLIECGNMKNAGDAAKMTSSAGRARYADGIVAGMRRYLHRWAVIAERGPRGRGALRLHPATLATTERPLRAVPAVGRCIGRQPRRRTMVDGPLDRRIRRGMQEDPATSRPAPVTGPGRPREPGSHSP